MYSSLWHCNQIARICLVTDDWGLAFTSEIMSATSVEGCLCGLLPLFWTKLVKVQPWSAGPVSAEGMTYLMDRITHIQLLVLLQRMPGVLLEFQLCGYLQ